MVNFPFILDLRGLEFFQTYLLSQGPHHIRVPGNPSPQGANFKMGRGRNQAAGQDC